MYLRLVLRAWRVLSGTVVGYFLILSFLSLDHELSMSKLNFIAW